MTETAVELRHREKYSAIIEFCKAIFSLATAVLTAFAGILLVSGSRVEIFPWGATCVGLIIASVLLALYGFGRSVEAVGSGNAVGSAIACANVSPWPLLLAVMVGLYVGHQYRSPLSVDETLGLVTLATKPLPEQLTPARFRGILLKDDDYVVEYDVEGRIVTVVVSRRDREIRSIR